MPRTMRQPLGWIALSGLGLLLPHGREFDQRAGSGGTVLPPGAVAPAERQRQLARRIGNILEEAHYRRASIDDRMSPEIFDRYVDSLDSQRSYFLASDIAEFTSLQNRFDDMIRSGELEPAFLIFARFQQRNRERIGYAIEAAGHRTGLDARRELRVRSRQGALARDDGRARRNLAQAREERWPVAAAHRQDLDRIRRHAAQALRARAQARGPGQRRTMCSRT